MASIPPRVPITSIPPTALARARFILLPQLLMMVGMPDSEYRKAVEETQQNSSSADEPDQESADPERTEDQKPTHRITGTEDDYSSGEGK